MTTALTFIAPALGLTLCAFVLLALDALDRRMPHQVRTTGFWLALIGLVASAALIPGAPAEPIVFGRGMLVWDGLSMVVTWLGILSAGTVLLMSFGTRAYDGFRLAAYQGLVLLCTTGVVLVAMSRDFLMALIAIELVSLPLVVLCGYLRKQPAARQAAMKFFLISAFSTAMFVYGLSILYGILGSTSFEVLSQNMTLLEANRTLSILAFVMILVSFGFKIALFPFHWWVPDVFDGAPTPVAAFLSVAPKLAGAAVALRVFSLVMDPGSLGLLSLLAVLCALTMTVGNLLGLQQTNVIRLMGYSSIAHMGYLLLGLVAGGGYGMTGFYLYATIYLFMNAGAFVLLMIFTEAAGSREISALNGFSTRAPLWTALLALFLMSLAGIPPLAGFVAKFYVLSAAFKAGWLWLAAIGVLNSLISAAYYFRILKSMYFNAPEQNTPIRIGAAPRVLVAVASFVTLLAGLAPQVLLRTFQSIAGTATVHARAEVKACCAMKPLPIEDDHAPHEQ